MPSVMRAAITILSIAILTACSSSDSDESKTVSGYTLTAIDGYLYRAEVCVDDNQNHACDEGEPVLGATDEDGRFDVPADNENDKIVVRIVPDRTIDQDDGLPIGNEYNLAAPRGSEIFTPFTHLAMIQGKTINEVATDLGLLVEDIAGDYIAAKEGASATSAKQAHHVAKFIAEQLQQGMPVDADLTDKAIAVKEMIDFIRATDPNADVDDFVVVVNSDGNASYSKIPSFEYSFSQTTEYYRIWQDTKNDCDLGQNAWVVEKVRYVPQGDATSGEYSRTGCALSTDATLEYIETNEFEAADTFMTWLVFRLKSFNRYDYISDYQALKACVVVSNNPPDSPEVCPVGSEHYEVIGKEDAQALLDVLNILYATEERKITVERISTVIAYTQGASYTNGDNTLQCNLDRAVKVGDDEVSIVELQRDEDDENKVTLTVVDVNGKPVDPTEEPVQLEYNATVQTVSGSNHKLDEDELFTFSSQVDESYTWNAEEGEEGVFEGTLSETNVLTWILGNNVSACPTTYSIVMTPKSSPAQVYAFLEQ